MDRLASNSLASTSAPATVPYERPSRCKRRRTHTRHAALRSGTLEKPAQDVGLQDAAKHILDQVVREGFYESDLVQRQVCTGLCSQWESHSEESWPCTMPIAYSVHVPASS